jgi:hypothetical protein
MHLTLFQKSLSSILRGRGTITIEVLEAHEETVAAVARRLPEEDSLSSASADQRANGGAQHAKAQYMVSMSGLVDIEQRT